MSDLVYGLSRVQNGTKKETIQFNIAKLKDYINYMEKVIRQTERDYIKYNSILLENKLRLEQEKTYLTKCINNKFVK